MTIYYVSSFRGSDGNNGLDAGTAFRTLDRVSKLNLEPGDKVLLEKGSVFSQALVLNQDDDGAAGKEIVISTFGSGKNPVITNTANGYGVFAQGSDHVVIENIDVTGTKFAGLKGIDSDNWTIRNVNVSDTGGVTTNDGGINWRNSNHVQIEGTTVKNTYGDNVFLQTVNDVVVKNSTLIGVHGKDADNLQISGNNVLVQGNNLTAGFDPTVNKGNFVYQGDGLVADNNTMKGGAFGISVSADHVVITNNTLLDHNKFSWSMGIGLSDETTGDVSDGVQIHNNLISGAAIGISIFGAAETKKSSDVMLVKDLDITSNHFQDWGVTAIKITNTTAQGTLLGNSFDEKFGGLWSNSLSKTNVAGMVQGNNTVSATPLASKVVAAAVKPAAVVMPEPDAVLTIRASGDQYLGAPHMKVYQNGKVIFETDVTASTKAGQKTDFSVKLQDFDADDKFSIQFTNDKSTGGGDRNLHVHSINVDGDRLRLGDGDVMGKVLVNKAKTLVSFNGNGRFNFDGDDVGGEPAGVHAKAAALAMPIHEVVALPQSIHSVGANASSISDAYTSMDQLHTHLHQVLDSYFD